MIKKVWKILLISIMMLIAMIYYSNTVNAVNLAGHTGLMVYYSGDASFADGNGSKYNDLFCVQNGTILNAGTFLRVRDYIEIDGNTSKYNGKEVVSTDNGIMGYILAQSEPDKSRHFNGEWYSPKQMAVYGFFSNWANSIGLNFTSNGGGYSNNEWVNSGRDYANGIQNAKKASVEDRTNKDNVRLVSIEHNGKSYIQAGPFNWSYTGNISNIQVLDQNNKAINGVLYAKYIGKELNIYENAQDAISSENGFYIAIPADAGVEKISKVTGKVSCSHDVYTAKIWTLEKGGVQHLISTVSGTKTDTSEVNIDFEYNMPLIMDLSGYVWEDKKGGKTNAYDNVYHGQSYTGEDGQIYDGNDVLIEGIKVELKDNDGNVIKEATTDKEGKYKFTDILITNLGKYHVEFTYNGLKYTSVIPFVGSDDSINSKSGEVVEQRKALNIAFTEITNADNINARNQGYSRDNASTVTSNLSYNNDTANWKSTFENTTYNTNLNANTIVTSYSIEEQFKNKNYIVNDQGKPEIQYINLGIYEREQPQMSISNDIDNVEVTVNGYSHIYNYAQRNSYIENGTAFNVGVKFGNSYTNTYTRAIYPSDVQYSSTDAQDSNKLRVYVTYALTIHNLSDNLSVSANELVNYYDKEYTIIDSWLGDDQNNKVSWNSTSKYGGSYNDGNYVGVYTTGLANAKVTAGQNCDKVYIKFQVSDNAVLGLLNGNSTLNNVTEIYSYSTYYGDAKEGCNAGDIYAGIDEESAPGNAKPGDIATYEADTDKAPSLILEATGVREIEGTVFEDSTADDLQSGKERLGDGLYNNEENTVGNVKVELITIDGNVATIYPNSFVDGKCIPNTKGEKAVITTGTNGYYNFKGIEPGEYLIKYTYENGSTKIFDTNGNEVKNVTVQDYKSTILKSSTIINAFNNGDSEWYKKEVDARYSDARDDYKQREAIDTQIENINNQTLDSQELIKDLSAQTPEFDMGIEFETVYTASTGEAYTYKISNADFGISERPRQSATLEKQVSNIKVTLSNGQVLVDGDPKSGLDYIIYTDGTIYVTIDNELLYGSHIEIKYNLVLTNTSELDYREQSYYYYGKVEDENNIVKVTSSTLIDYVDSELTIKAGDENGNWSVIANATDLAQKGLTLTDEEVESLLKQYSTVVTAEAIPENTTIAPGESANATIALEKLLATSDDLSYENNGEVVTITKTGGSSMTTTLGSYAKVLLENPDAPALESDEAKAYTVTIIPPTGAENYTTYIIVSIVSLVALGAGIYVIRKIVKL